MLRSCVDLFVVGRQLRYFKILKLFVIAENRAYWTSLDEVELLAWLGLLGILVRHSSITETTLF